MQIVTSCRRGCATLLVSALLMAPAHLVTAQVAATPAVPSAAAGAMLPLPDGVKQVVSLDAYNVLLAQTGTGTQSSIGVITVRHIYSGGLARLFGGLVIPTGQFVSPGAAAGNAAGAATPFGVNRVGNGANSTAASSTAIPGAGTPGLGSLGVLAVGAPR